MGFFSYFLLVRTASVFSGCEEGKETVFNVYTTICMTKKRHFKMHSNTVGGSLVLVVYAQAKSVWRNDSE